MSLLLVAGPPCSGKSSFAKATGRTVLDWDVIYAEIAGRPLHVRVSDLRVMRDTELRFRGEVDQAWGKGAEVAVIRGAPQRWMRGMYRRLYHARVVVLAVPAEECLRRLETSLRAAEVKRATTAAIADWWARYEPSPQDVTVTTPAEVPPGMVVA